MPAGPGGLGEQRREPQHPQEHGHVVHLDAPLGEQLLYIPVRQPVPQIPTHRDRDHLGGNRSPANADLSMTGPAARRRRIRTTCRIRTSPRSPADATDPALHVDASGASTPLNAHLPDPIVSRADGIDPNTKYCWPTRSVPRCSSYSTPWLPPSGSPSCCSPTGVENLHLLLLLAPSPQVGAVGHPSPRAAAAAGGQPGSLCDRRCTPTLLVSGRGVALPACARCSFLRPSPPMPTQAPRPPVPAAGR